LKRARSFKSWCIRILHLFLYVRLSWLPLGDEKSLLPSKAMKSSSGYLHRHDKNRRENTNNAIDNTYYNIAEIINRHYLPWYYCCWRPCTHFSTTVLNRNMPVSPATRVWPRTVWTSCGRRWPANLAGSRPHSWVPSSVVASKPCL